MLVELIHGFLAAQGLEVFEDLWGQSEDPGCSRNSSSPHFKSQALAHDACTSSEVGAFPVCPPSQQ